MSIAENVAHIRAEIEKAALAAGRDPKQITLCSATKMNNAEKVRQAIAAGITCCGENRVQELTEKLSQNAYEGADIHFIGHLQTNKVKQVVGKVDVIQSVDSLRLLEAIQKEAARQGIRQDILLELNTENIQKQIIFIHIEHHRSSKYAFILPPSDRSCQDVLPSLTSRFRKDAGVIPIHFLNIREKFSGGIPTEMDAVVTSHRVCSISAQAFRIRNLHRYWYGESPVEALKIVEK